MQHLVRLIESLADIFARMGVRHAFGGAIASNYWGIVRTTQDVDCLVLVPAIQYQRLADELTGHGFVMCDETGRNIPVKVPAMLEQVRDRKLIEVFQDSLRAELFVPFIPLQDEVLRRAVALPFRSRTMPVTTAEDLILLKMTFHRDKDLIDVRGILWVQRGKLDLDYLREWSGRMLSEDCVDELDEMVKRYVIASNPLP